MLPLSKLYKVNQVGVNMNYVYELLCIQYNDHHRTFCIKYSVVLTKCWKSVRPTLETLVPRRHRENTDTAFCKSSKWRLLYTQCVRSTLIRGDLVDDSPSKTWWWGDSSDAQRIYLCQPMLLSVYDSSHMICNVQLCAFKIEIYCMFLFILVYLLYEYV